MLEIARQYALEILHGLSECVNRDDLIDLIICDWTINSGCEYDNQCCDPVSCCDSFSYDNENVTCNLSFEMEDVYKETIVITEEGEEVEIQVPVIDVINQICNITIKEI